MPEVVVVNVHGGFPSAMVSRALCELKGFRELREIAAVHERVYPTNACAGPAFHDTFMDAPLGTMSDSVWHPWAHGRRATRSIFHIFQQYGYRTRVFGAFGLDARLDPHAHMHINPNDLEKALQMYGIDECDAQDAAFTCQLGLAYDRDMLRRVVAHLADPTRPSDSFTLVNLLGCQDAHKCTFHDVDPERVAIPVMRFEDEGRDFDERIFSETVIDDDPRRSSTSSHTVDALRRAANLKDWVRGARCGELEREDLVRTVTGLHRFCWKCMGHIDDGIQQMIAALRKTNRFKDAVFYLYSDHAISLYEHGELCEAPWDACLRSFLMRRAPCVTPSYSSTPLSLANLPSILFNDCGIFADWHVAPALDGCCLTLGIAMSWLARASVAPVVSVFQLRTFFVRAIVVHNSRSYGAIMWFSLDDLARANNIDIDLSPSSKATIMREITTWANPVLDASFAGLAAQEALQVYDHTSDPRETSNLAAHSDWIASPAAKRIKEEIDRAIRHHRLQTITATVPENVHEIGSEHVTFCSVQLHHRIRDRVRSDRPTPAPTPTSIQHVSTQTDEPTLARSVGHVFGEVAANLVSTQIRESSEAILTIFVPIEDGLPPYWPSWAPPPVRGAHGRDDLLRAAKEGAGFTDVVRGDTHKVARHDHEHVFFESCRVVLRSATKILHAHGFAVAYRTYRHGKAATSTIEDDKTDSDNVSEIISLVSPASTHSDGQETRRTTSRTRIQNSRSRIATTSSTHVAQRGKIRSLEMGAIRKHM